MLGMLELVAGVLVLLALADRCWPTLDVDRKLVFVGGPWRNAALRLRRRWAVQAAAAWTAGAFDVVAGARTAKEARDKRGKFGLGAAVGLLWVALAAVNYCLLAQIIDFLAPSETSYVVPVVGNCGVMGLAFAFVLIFVTALLSIWCHPLLVPEDGEPVSRKTRLAALAAVVVIVLETVGAYRRGYVAGGSVVEGSLSAAIGFVVVWVDLFAGAFAWTNTVRPAWLMLWSRVHSALLWSVVGLLHLISGDLPRALTSPLVARLRQELRLLAGQAQQSEEALGGAEVTAAGLKQVVEHAEKVADPTRFGADFTQVSDEVAQVERFAEDWIGWVEDLQAEGNTAALFGEHVVSWQLLPGHSLREVLPDAALSPASPRRQYQEAQWLRARLTDFLDTAAMPDGPLQRLQVRAGKLLAVLRQTRELSQLPAAAAALRTHAEACRQVVVRLGEPLGRLRTTAEARQEQLGVELAALPAALEPTGAVVEADVRRAQLEVDLRYNGETLCALAALAERETKLLQRFKALDTSLAALVRRAAKVDQDQPLGVWEGALEQCQRQLAEVRALLGPHSPHPTRRALLERLRTREERLLALQRDAAEQAAPPRLQPVRALTAASRSAHGQFNQKGAL